MERQKVIIACPGPTWHFGAAQSACNAVAGRHDAIVVHSGGPYDNINYLWVKSLAANESGHLNAPRWMAMQHADVAAVAPGWAATMVENSLRTGYAAIAAAIPIRDERGLTTVGIGNPDNPWRPWRRMTVRELCARKWIVDGRWIEFGDTFTAADLGYPGWPLLFNEGMLVVDMARPEFHRSSGPDGELDIWFNTVRQPVRLPDGKLELRWESEDWYFARKVHQAGMFAAIDASIVLQHDGPEYPNDRPWGTYENGDEDTAESWRR